MASTSILSTQRWRKLISWIFILGLAGFFLYLSLRKINWVNFQEVIITAHYELLIFSFVFASVSNFIRSQRWRVLLNAESTLSRMDVFWATMIGYMGNSYLPARAGDFMRSAVLGKTSKLGMSFVLATTFTERIVDAVALLIASAISLMLLDVISETMTFILRSVAILGGLGLIVLLFSQHLIRPLIGLLVKLPLPNKVKIHINVFLERFFQGMNTLQHSKIATTFITYTIFIWLIDGLLAIFNALILSLSLKLPQAMLLLASMGFSSAIPSTPGYLGVYQFVAVSILPQFNFTKSQALAFIVIIQVMNYIVVTFWGLIGCWRMRFTLKFRKI